MKLSEFQLTQINILSDIEVVDTYSRNQNKGKQIRFTFIAQPTKAFCEYDKYIIDQQLCVAEKHLAN